MNISLCKRCGLEPVLDDGCIKCYVCNCTVYGQGLDDETANRNAIEGWNKLNETDIPLKNTIYIWPEMEKEDI